MATYSIQAPDGNTYSVTGPDGATPQQVQEEVLRQNPNAGAPKASDQAAPPGGNSLQSRLLAPADGANSAVAHTLGFPVDAGTSVVNLARSLMGQPRVPLSSQAYGGDWFEGMLNQAGVSTKPDNPADPVQRYGAAVGSVAPAIASGNVVTGMRAIAGATGAQLLADNGAPEWAQMAAGIAGNKTGISDITRVGATAALTKLEAGAAPRVQQNLQAAQSVAPGLQTAAQSTGVPLLAKLGQGAAGATTAEASASIVDKLAGGMTAQAKRIAPVGVSNPEVAGQVQKVLAQKDSDLASKADAIYTDGRKKVGEQGAGQVIQTPNLLAAYQALRSQVADPGTLAPPVGVSPRAAGARPSAAPLPGTVPQASPAAIQPGMGGMGAAPQFGGIGVGQDKPSLPTTAAPPGNAEQTRLDGFFANLSNKQQAKASTVGTPGLSWQDFYDVRKQLNTLYSDIPRDTITPAMDATFAQLKSAYYKDLSAAPDGPAKDTTITRNQIYGGIQDERDTLKNSVVASVLGKDGTKGISDPDHVLDRIVGLKPAAQSYVRDILTQYAPETLDALRGYAITKNVQDAARTGVSASVSGTNPRALTPGKLAESGLFTTEQASELNARESALKTALNALPEKGAPTAELDPQSVGRLAGGMSPVFLAGAASKVLTAGKLERALNTPEGRNRILHGTMSRDQEVQQAVKAYQAALLAQVATDRKSAQQPNGPGTAP